MRNTDIHLFVDECLRRLGVAFAHVDEDAERKASILEVYSMLERRVMGDKGSEVVQTVSRLILV